MKLRYVGESFGVDSLTNGVVSSASNDGVSVSYDTSKSVSAQTELYRAASLYLMSTGLLYRGLSHVGVY